MSIPYPRPNLRPLVVPALLLLLLASGCSGLSEAVADGLFAGISTTVADLVTDALQTGSGL